MSKIVRKEWKKYMFNENEHYDDEQVINKIKEICDYLQMKHLRIVFGMTFFSEYIQKQYHLTDEEKRNYANIFRANGYVPDACKTLVQTTDALYHMLDISKEEAMQLSLYTAENHLTLSEAIENKYDFSINEFNEFMETVLIPDSKYLEKRMIQNSKEMIDLLKEYV